MVLERFLEWVAAAPVRARADAARSLVAAYSDVGSERTRVDHLDRMVGTLLNDSSITVRRAMAEAAARSVDVKRAVVVALAHDDPSVAVPVLAGSPLLTEADLIDAVTSGDPESQAAVAGRLNLPARAAAALAERGHRDPVLTLCLNQVATLPSAAMRRIHARFPDDAEIREALLDRPELEPGLHHDLAMAATRTLTDFAQSCGWMSTTRAGSLERDLADRAAVTIASHGHRARPAESALELAHHLRARSRLTPALLLRAVLSGQRALFAATLSQLSGVALKRVEGHLGSPQGFGFAALYERACLPLTLLPVFRAALQATAGRNVHPAEEGILSRSAVAQVLSACLAEETPETARVVALLRRFEAEALRDEPRWVSAPSLEPVRHPRAPDLGALRRTEPRVALPVRDAA